MASRRVSQERGLTLIETLVALVLLSLGMLAAVALLLVAKRNTADALQRTVAAQLAYDMLERMRGNSGGLATYVAAAAPHVGRGSRPEAPRPACTAAAGGAAPLPCDATELALQDLWQWEQALDGAAETAGGDRTGGLVQPTACIAGPANGDSGFYTVTIAWRGRVELPDDGAVGCGRGAAAGGEALYGPGDVLRRTLSIPVFIAARGR